MTKIDQKENINMSNLLPLASSAWIVADFYLIAGVAKSCLYPHMQWYQGLEPNVSTLGFISFDHQVQYFLTLEGLKKGEDSCYEMDHFWRFPRSF
jgi:hypothetical protein